MCDEEEAVFSPWEPIPIEYIGDGCSDVILKDVDGNERSMCTCDYWWLDKEEKKKYVSFVFDNSVGDLDEDEEGGDLVSYPKELFEEFGVPLIDEKKVAEINEKFGFGIGKYREIEVKNES